MTTRPKRKNAGNKNYLDALPEGLLEDQNDPPSANVKAAPAGRKPKKTTPLPPSTGKLPYNWQPPVAPGDYFSNKLNLEGAYVDTLQQSLFCPEQPSFHLRELEETTARPTSRRRKEPYFCLRKGDYIYMVSEPPGEPYYIGRVMGFARKSKMENTPPDDSPLEDASLFVFQIQWFYRPRDISKHTLDSRLLYASMHSDTCPLQSFRGVVTVKHKLEIDASPKFAREGTPMLPLEAYCLIPNCFYFDKLFDRYMIKFYDIIKTSLLLQYVSNAANNSQNYILALNKRFEFVFMEPSRSKQFIANFESNLSSHCDVCSEWCAPNELVTCAGCEKHFHMLCLDPPLLKKPSRGFSWSCALCTKKHELEYQSKKMVMLSHDNRSSNEKEISEMSDTVLSSPQEPEEPEESPRKSPEVSLPKYELLAKEFLNNDADLSVEERRLKEEWSMRYLGIHTRLEDAVDLDDRSPYPRASTSLGPKYQASNIPEYIDHPIVYYDDPKAAENGKKKAPGKRGAKKKTIEEDTKRLPLPKQFEDVPPKEYPQWLQPRPKGYVERGVDDGDGETCTLLWKNREEDVADNFAKLDDYVRACNPIAQRLNMFPTSPNFVDAILKIWLECNGDAVSAIDKVSQLTRASLKEPTFSPEEIKRFENGVKKNGSELYPTYKLVKSQPCSMVVRFYYLWKKSPRGRQIWGNFPGRKKKLSSIKDEKPAKVVENMIDSDDDSSYENEKIAVKRRKFCCKHCKTYKSTQWFRITGFDENTKYDESLEAEEFDPEAVLGLCFRCARLWRRYAVYWEDPHEVERRNTRGIGGYKKKVEAELVADAEKILTKAQMEGGGLSYDPVVLKPGESSVSILKTPLSKPEAEPNNYSKRVAAIANITIPSPTKLPDIVYPRPPAKPRAQKPASNASKTSNNSVKPPASTKRANGRADAQVKLEEPSEKKRKPLTSTNGVAKTETKPKPKPRKKSPIKEEDKEDSIAAQEVKKAVPVASSKKRPQQETKEPAARPQKQKRQKRTTSSDSVVPSPILNPDYRVSESAGSLAKVDKKLYFKLDEKKLYDLITTFKSRQLVDLKLLMQAFQAPSQANIELPFSVNDRNCCVCTEYDDRDDSLLEMLICSNCGVNVHASCAGIAISGKQKPVKQWLCDACVNDLSPHYTTTYSCCLCLANEQNYEMSILGSPLVKPDFLMPVLDSGKWAHLLCALFSHKQISFRNVTTPSFVSKEVLYSTSTKQVGCAIESVSNVFLENYTSRCSICKSLSGAMIQCDGCKDLEEKFHITCAQDTPNFKLGFKLVPQKISKSNTNTYIGDDAGKLEPVLLCPRHDQRGAIHNMRTLGKRTLNGELKPLMLLFIEDLARLTNSRCTGPQLKAQNYMKMVEKFTETEEEMAAKYRAPTEYRKEKEKERKEIFCDVCKVTASPKWWPSPQNPGALICRNCHLLDNAERADSELEGDQLAKELNEPIRAEHFGLQDPLDHILQVYKQPEAPNVERSMITLSEILW